MNWIRINEGWKTEIGNLIKIGLPKFLKKRSDELMDKHPELIIDTSSEYPNKWSITWRGKYVGNANSVARYMGYTARKVYINHNNQTCPTIHYLWIASKRDMDKFSTVMDSRLDGIPQHELPFRCLESLCGDYYNWKDMKRQQERGN